MMLLLYPKAQPYARAIKGEDVGVAQRRQALHFAQEAAGLVRIADADVLHRNLASDTQAPLIYQNYSVSNPQP